jgi:hypothetical protein
MYQLNKFVNYICASLLPAQRQLRKMKRKEVGSMSNIGEQFTTGENAPVSGVYRYVRHAQEDCTNKIQDHQIPLSRGEKFPPHRTCSGGVIWELAEIT